MMKMVIVMTFIPYFDIMPGLKTGLFFWLCCDFGILENPSPLSWHYRGRQSPRALITAEQAVIIICSCSLGQGQIIIIVGRSLCGAIPEINNRIMLSFRLCRSSFSQIRQARSILRHANTGHKHKPVGRSVCVLCARLPDTFKRKTLDNV